MQDWCNPKYVKENVVYGQGLWPKGGSKKGGKGGLIMGLLVMVLALAGIGLSALQLVGKRQGFVAEANVIDQSAYDAKTRPQKVMFWLMPMVDRVVVAAITWLFTLIALGVADSSGKDAMFVGVAFIHGVLALVVLFHFGCQRAVGVTAGGASAAPADAEASYKGVV